MLTARAVAASIGPPGQVHAVQDHGGRLVGIAPDHGRREWEERDEEFCSTLRRRAATDADLNGAPEAAARGLPRSAPRGS
jgi:hypothetical protein